MWVIKRKSALAACAVIADWPDCDPVTMHTVEIDQVEAYVPGEFYKRELPCILQVLSELTIRPTFIVVDGFVWLDANQKKGLGAHLYDELNQSVPIIGVAKTSFATATTAVEIYRGGSTRPLWITACRHRSERCCKPHSVDARGTSDSKHPFACGSIE